MCVIDFLYFTKHKSSIFKITKNDTTLMSQVYLIFSTSHFLWNTNDIFTNFGHKIKTKKHSYGKTSNSLYVPCLGGFKLMQ